MWNTPTRQCIWALNRATWTSPGGKKGIWAFTCSVKPDSVGQTKRIDDHENNGCKCGLVPPSKKPKSDIKIHLEDDCKHDDRQPSTFLNNYHQCEKTSKGLTLWVERTCGSNFFWHQQLNKCVVFDELPLEIQQQYCQHGCVDRCAGGHADTTNRSIEFPTWPDQSPTCTECGDVVRIPNIEYCKNYRICSSSWTWDEYWEDVVCPTQTPFWHQMTSCKGECKKWADLPQSLKEYYIAHPCCPTPDKNINTTTTHKIPTGTIADTQNTTTTEDVSTRNRISTTTHLNEQSCPKNFKGPTRAIQNVINASGTRR
ncbi:unnamed protein product [Allacma fusca]|uniref:Uncharacterized protein n=1 Tax=Allacma fusca TaxID=39272 RepID=A0A8J2NTB6_9HEXA|nr:unnamed protein product [Allacma fusca]